MNVLKFAHLRPLMSLETVASAFGEHWVPPGEDGYLTCAPGSVSARLDAEGRLGYITFLRTCPGQHRVVDRLPYINTHDKSPENEDRNRAYRELAQQGMTLVGLTQS